MTLPQRFDGCPKTLLQLVRKITEQAGSFRLTAFGVALVHHPHARASRTPELSLCWRGKSTREFVMQSNSQQLPAPANTNPGYNRWYIRGYTNHIFKLTLAP